MAVAGHGAYTGCAVRLTSRKRFPDIRVKSEQFWCGSSAAEHSADNRKADGSIPSRTTIITGYRKVWSILPPLEGGGAGSNPATLTCEASGTALGNPHRVRRAGAAAMIKSSLTGSIPVRLILILRG